MAALPRVAGCCCSAEGIDAGDRVVEVMQPPSSTPLPMPAGDGGTAAAAASSQAAEESATAEQEVATAEVGAGEHRLDQGGAADEKVGSNAEERKWAQAAPPISEGQMRPRRTLDSCRSRLPERVSAALGTRRRLCDDSGMLDPEVSEFVSFSAGGESLLRASRLYTVMRRGASILINDDEGPADTYSLSQVVSAIEVFLSHNWSVSRWSKLVCLTLHFNFHSAVAASLATLVVGVVVTSLGVRPVEMETELFGVPNTVKISLNCSFPMAPIFILCLFFAHEFQRLIGFCGPSVFLDKTCIHQTDEALQEEGIRKLGAFIRNSSSMLIIYTDVYLKKLWTVYEVACFLSMHRTSHMTVCPISLPVTVFIGVAILYVTWVIMPFFMNASAAWMYWGLRLVVIFSAILAFAGILRFWAKSKQDIRERVARFTVDECVCFLESDRPVVYSNITLLMRATGGVSFDAQVEEALDKFNELVRKHVDRSIITSLGPCGISYQQVVAMFLCTQVPHYVDVYVLSVHSGSDSEDWLMRYRFFTMLDCMIWLFGGFPLLVAFASKCCGCCLHLRGCLELAYVLAVAVAALVAQQGFTQLVNVFWEASIWGASIAGAVGMVTLLVATASLAMTVYTSGRRQLQKEEEAEDEEHELWQQEAAAAVAGGVAPGEEAAWRHTNICQQPAAENDAAG